MSWVYFMQNEQNQQQQHNNNTIEHVDKTESEWGLCLCVLYGESKYYGNRDKNQNPIRLLTCVKWSKCMPRFLASIRKPRSKMKWEVKTEQKVWSSVTIIKWIMDTMLCTMSMNSYYKEPYGKFGWFFFCQRISYFTAKRLTLWECQTLISIGE